MALQRRHNRRGSGTLAGGGPAAEPVSTRNCNARLPKCDAALDAVPRDYARDRFDRDLRSGAGPVPEVARRRAPGEMRGRMDDEAFERRLAAVPRERTQLLPALLLAEQTSGYISDGALRRIAAHLRLTVNEVEGVATAYPELHREPRRAPVVAVCTGTACNCAGAQEVLARLEEMAQTGSLEVEEVACSFLCAVGPIVEIDGLRHGRVSPDGLAALLERGELDG